MNNSEDLSLTQTCLPFGNRETDHLDAIEPSDIEWIRRWRNAQLAILRQSKPISTEEQNDYWNHVAFKQMQEQKPALLLFAYRQQRELLGYGGFVRIQWDLQQAELSTLINSDIVEPSPEFIELSRRFIGLSLRFAAAIGFKTLTTECYDFRLDMIDLLEQFGFERKSYQPNVKKLEFSDKPMLMVGSWHHIYHV